MSLLDNRLQTVPATICNLINLTELYIQDNFLRRLPESLGRLQSLTHLNLADNLLTSIPRSIGNLSLDALGLSNNLLRMLPDFVTNLRNLRGTEVITDGNPFYSVGPSQGSPKRRRLK